MKKLSNTCEYRELCSSLLIDRLICGIRDDTLRERLLRQKDLTLDKAIQMCKSAELISAQVTAIKPTDNAVMEVHQVENEHVIKSCKFCGGSHTYGKIHCPAARKKCDTCDKIGHFAKK